MQIPPAAGKSNVHPSPGNVYGVSEHRKLLTLKRNKLLGKTLNMDCLLMLPNKRRVIIFTAGLCHRFYRYQPQVALTIPFSHRSYRLADDTHVSW